MFPGLSIPIGYPNANYNTNQRYTIPGSAGFGAQIGAPPPLGAPLDYGPMRNKLLVQIIYQHGTQNLRIEAKT